MKLTRASSYALHAVAYMADQDNNNPVASHVIAKARKIPERFLLKVLKPLVSDRVLLSVKGPNGGYRLAKPANDITLLEVIESVDGRIRGSAPLSGEKKNGHLNSKLESICKESAEQIRKHLGGVKISQLVPKKGK